MITVHHLNNSRSQRILWLLEELGVEYKIEHYQRDPKTILAPDSLKKIHPLGKSPVITDSSNDVTVAESGAIIDYLASTYGKGSMLPDPTQAAYRQYQYWLHYAEGSLMPPLLMNLIFSKMKNSPMPFFIKPVAKMLANKVMSAYVQPNIDTHLAYIEDHLKHHEWFAGDTLTGADIQMSFPLEASVARGVITSQYPNTQSYVQRIQSRPAYQKALKAGGEYDYAL